MHMYAGRKQDFVQGGNPGSENFHTPPPELLRGGQMGTKGGGLDDLAFEYSA